jgi:hypothetical protein
MYSTLPPLEEATENGKVGGRARKSWTRLAPAFPCSRPGDTWARPACQSRLFSSSPVARAHRAGGCGASPAGGGSGSFGGGKSVWGWLVGWPRRGLCGAPPPEAGTTRHSREHRILTRGHVVVGAAGPARSLILCGLPACLHHPLGQLGVRVGCLSASSRVEAARESDRSPAGARRPCECAIAVACDAPVRKPTPRKIPFFFRCGWMLC